MHTQLPALFDEGTPEKIAQIKNDYRETLADLHLAYIQDWTRWAHSHGMMPRNQAHGGPDNLLDTYAAADIPEMEIYSAYSENQMPMMKIPRNINAAQALKLYHQWKCALAMMRSSAPNDCSI